MNIIALAFWKNPFAVISAGEGNVESTHWLSQGILTEEIQKHSLFCLYSLPPVIPTRSKANSATPSPAVAKLIRILFNKFLITSKSSRSDSLVTTSVFFFFSLAHVHCYSKKYIFIAILWLEVWAYSRFCSFYCGIWHSFCHNTY